MNRQEGNSKVSEKMRYGGKGTNPERPRGIKDEYISHHFFFLLRVTPVKITSFYQPLFLEEESYFSSFFRSLVVRQREKERNRESIFVYIAAPCTAPFS